LCTTLSTAEVRVSRAKSHQHSDCTPRPRGLEIGVTESVSLSALDLIIGGGAQDAGACVSDRRFTCLVDGGGGVEFYLSSFINGIRLPF
jgi:hypothetical protein